MKKRGKINVLIEYINIYNYIVNILFTIIYICLIFLGSICSKVYIYYVVAVADRPQV
ncbi:protein of unknown function [Tepidanaerobacter acetatoxydans Re1]|uniref:Uncharacterized protein n=1 Tax=Tepidanaerobacter acetatoxydans (strain DSM 21804 / JCM 16047 / Re1) TaxID=1209989 RepID=U4Q9A5_TEPAE|nr:protein of unknown function [Tepidanaerobacter acetatoxydans Re1]